MTRITEKTERTYTVDGREFASLDNAVRHAGYFWCPKCDGSGSTQEEYDSYPSGLPDSEYVQQIGVRDVPCDVCHGLGYTENEMKAVYKLVGYEEIIKPIIGEE